MQSVDKKLNWIKPLIQRSLVSTLLLALSLNSTSATADEIKKPNWLAACPEVVDTTPDLPTPKTKELVFQNSGQLFKLLRRGTTELVTEPTSVIGCYVIENAVTNPNQSPPWQIGSLNRDSQGYYFKNAAGTTWRLKLSTNGTVFELQPGAPYYSEPGMGFRIDTEAIPPADCKFVDYRLGGLRLGFPRSKQRVPAVGTTKNLIIVLDYPDAPFTGNLTEAVNNVLGPDITREFFAVNSYNKLNLTFDIHPKVVRVPSSEKSFAPNSSGGFFVDGVQQDTRLIKEALLVANQQADLSGYQSVNFFAPTGDSLRYYGAAHIGLELTVGSDKLLNSQLVSGLIGNIMSSVPSWKVFAHEYGHLLGFYDLYIPFTSNSGKSPGPFDLMGNTSGSANTFLGFNRWVQGWLSDNDVQCDTGIVTKTVTSLNAINATSGNRLYVHPLSGTLALVIEYRPVSKFDQLGDYAGLLVYTVNLKVGTGEGPIQIYHSEQDRPVYIATDIERYRAAALTTGQHAVVQDLVVYANSVVGDSANFTVMSKVEFSNFQASQVKPAIPNNSAKKTITCVKGTVIKKVKAIKPKCPAGYKKK